jgi:uncharacterized protein YeaC (DUF1315 family)
MMNIDQILAALTPEIVERFRTAIEIGKWPNGQLVTDEQRATCLQAVVIWEHQHLPEQERTGYIHKGSKKEGDECDSHDHKHDPDAELPIRFV